jgi:hypothetical protein
MTIRNAQLIHREEKVIYLKDGQVCETPSTEIEKLAHSIFGETKIMKTETIVDRFRVKNQSEATNRFWDWIEENKVDSRDYYLVFTE